MRKIVYTLILLVSFIHADGIKKDLYKTALQWNSAINTKDLRALSALYDKRVVYNGVKMRAKKVLHDKKRLFDRYPYASQKIKDIQFRKLAPKLYKVTFHKFVKLRDNTATKRHSGYLLIDTSSVLPLITEEGESVIKHPIAKPHQSIKTEKLKRYYFDQPVTISGKVHAQSDYSPSGHHDIFNRISREVTYILKLPRAIKVSKQNKKNWGRDQVIISDEIELSTQDVKLLKLAMKHNLTVSITGVLNREHSRGNIRKLSINTHEINISSKFN